VIVTPRCLFANGLALICFLSLFQRRMFTEYLYLYDNQLDGNIPRELGSLSSLGEFYMAPDEQDAFLGLVFTL
jgi:hypothetical protein